MTKTSATSMKAKQRIPHRNMSLNNVDFCVNFAEWNTKIVAFWKVRPGAKKSEPAFFLLCIM